MQQILLLVILGATIVLLVSRVVRIEITALLIIGSLVATGILTPGEALAGLSNPATVTVGAMFMLSAGLARSGVLDFVGAKLRSASKGHRHRMLLLVGVAVVPFSAFINNTPIVIMMVPVMLSLAHDFDMTPSRLLIPVSYFAILGGTCTLLGTSTNILVDSIYRASGGPGFGVFDFARLGIVFVVIGGIYILLTANRLLPDRVALANLLSTTDRTKFVTEITISERSGLVGKCYGDVFPRDKIRLLQLVRGEEVVLGPAGDLVIESGDTLLVEANASTIHEMLSGPEVHYASAVQDEDRVSISSFDLTVAEAVVTPNSSFVNRRLAQIGLNRRYGIKVLAVRRLGRHHQYQLRDMRLRTGDVLLVQGEIRALNSLAEQQDVLIVEGVSETLRYKDKAPEALMIMAGVVLTAALGLLPIAIASLLGVAALLLSRCVSTAEAVRSVDASVVLLLAGTIPLGMAMEKTGIAAAIAGGALDVVGDFGPIAVLSCLYLLTNVMTEFMSNNATAVLLAPVALGIAAQFNVDPRPFLIMIAFAGSCSFSTPIGYQTNTIVMGPGGYTFFDFTKIGLPLNLLLWIVASIAVPLLWPL